MSASNNYRERYSLLRYKLMPGGGPGVSVKFSRNRLPESRVPTAQDSVDPHLPLPELPVPQK